MTKIKKDNNGVVAYHNDMNLVSFAGFKEKELDLFFSICHEMKEKGLNQISFSFSKIRELSNYSNRNISRLYADLDKVYKKMLELNLKYEDEKIIKRFTLFNSYIIKKEEQEISIKANEEFEYILNNFVGSFTLLELKTFVNLESKYSKNLYRLLCGNNWKRKAEFTIEEFRELLNIPKTYRLSEIDKYVLTPAKEELPKFFPNLKLEKIKKANRVISIIFTWSRGRENIIEGEIVEISITENLKKVITKARKNIYINKFLKDEHIKDLLETFEEKQLIIGLEYAYKNINSEFKKMIYLENSIKVGIEKIKIIITSNKGIEENREKDIKIEVEQQVIKTKLTLEEYENIYTEYLEKTNFKNTKINRNFWEMSTKNQFEIIEKKDKIIEDVPKIELQKKKDYEEYQEFLKWKKEKKNEGKKMIKNLIEQAFEKEISKSIIQEKEMTIGHFPEEYFLDKNGKKLIGTALKMRIRKLNKEKGINIDYKNL
ncbi:MAG: replication initiation protein [Fusobacteriaceae bacterium]